MTCLNRFKYNRLTMRKLSNEKRTQIVAALVEGNSIRSTSRITGCSTNTVLALIKNLGSVCAEYQDEHFKDLPCNRLQIDEVWSFCRMKQKNVPEELQGSFGVGDVWTFTAICADTKLVPSWRVGTRDSETAKEFVQDLSERLKNRIQITSDGHTMYVDAVEQAFGADVDYAMLTKLYGSDPEGQKRYSPSQYIGSKVSSIQGTPDIRHISTSYVERMNLTIRMGQRRYTRLTNAFSKKISNHNYSLAIFLFYYNFVRIHRSLRVTPAMAANVTGRLWSIKDMVALLEAKEQEDVDNGSLRRGSYKKAGISN